MSVPHVKGNQLFPFLLLRTAFHGSDCIFAQAFFPAVRLNSIFVAWAVFVFFGFEAPCAIVSSSQCGPLSLHVKRPLFPKTGCFFDSFLLPGSSRQLTASFRAFFIPPCSRTFASFLRSVTVFPFNDICRHLNDVGRFSFPLPPPCICSTELSRRFPKSISPKGTPLFPLLRIEFRTRSNDPWRPPTALFLDPDQPLLLRLTFYGYKHAAQFCPSGRWRGDATVSVTFSPNPRRSLHATCHPPFFGDRRLSTLLSSLFSASFYFG